MRLLRAAETALKHRRFLAGVFGAVLLLLGAAIVEHSALPRRTVMISAGGCRTPATVIEPTAGHQNIGSVLILHGLGANRRTMISIGSTLAVDGFRVYVPDLPGHGDNVDPFSFSRAEECAGATLQWLVHAHQLDPNNTALLGHSMGGAIAIRLADVLPVAATIAISPAPMILPRRMPSNLQVFSGAYDLWPMKRQAADLLAAAGGERTKADDFFEKRAFDVVVVPHGTHTSMIVDPTVTNLASSWAVEAVTSEVRRKVRETSAAARRSVSVLRGSALGLIGLGFLFYAVIPVAKIGATGTDEPAAALPSHLLLLAEQSVGALLAVLILALWIPLKFVRLYNGDYLASLLLLSSLFLLALNHRQLRLHSAVRVTSLIAAAALAFAIFLSLGGWLNWQIGDLWMNAHRWLRFAALLPPMFIFCFSEEVLLGPAGSGKKRWIRVVISLVMRLEVWLACLLAYYQLNNGQALVGVLVPTLAIFSLLQRLATDALRTQSRSPIAAATFGAILASWFVAAIFPLT